MWIWQKTEDSSFSKKNRTKFLVKLWVQKNPTPSPTIKFQFFRDILLPNNILGILTRGIVETIFTRKKRGRGWNPPPRPQ